MGRAIVCLGIRQCRTSGFGEIGIGAVVVGVGQCRNCSVRNRSVSNLYRWGSDSVVGISQSLCYGFYVFLGSVSVDAMDFENSERQVSVVGIYEFRSLGL